jgi:hypothetical protein
MRLTLANLINVHHNRLARSSTARGFGEEAKPRDVEDLDWFWPRIAIDNHCTQTNRKPWLRAIIGAQSGFVTIERCRSHGLLPLSSSEITVAVRRV